MVEINLLSFDLSAIWSKAWPIIVAILFFGLIIFIHELGHFTFAKLFKVKVNEFAMGMGPTILKKKIKETTYALRLLPIGGFVSMEGEDEDSDDERSFSKKPCWQRIIIVAAGAVMNLLLGLIICICINANQDLIATSTVAGFREDAVSISSGLQKEDKIIEIDDHSVTSYMDLSFLMMRDKDGVMDITVKRDGEKVRLNDVKFEMREYEDGTKSMYFDFVVYGVEPGFKNVITAASGETLSIIKVVYLSLFDLVTGQYGLNELSGPIGTVTYIADAATDAGKTHDWSTLLLIMALITINIGVFNLLPLPALDGGRLFFMVIELIRRKPIKQKYEAWIHAAGLALLIILMIVISASDILKLIK
ncbi:MAG: site-2 protease family protein [Clostridia bacterium]|nr:site-2 protease family protein [Clostridia bacterium]